MCEMDNFDYTHEVPTGRQPAKRRPVGTGRDAAAGSGGIRMICEIPLARPPEAVALPSRPASRVIPFR